MKEFKVEIITPERQFFSGMAEFVTVDSPNGQMTILSGHAPMVAALSVGKIVLQLANGKKTAFTAGGFMEVRPDETLIFAQKCEWPEEIDENRALADEMEAKDRLLQKQSMMEYRESKIMLVRALMRLSVKHGGLDK